MYNPNLNTELVVNVLRQMLCRIYAAVLATCTSETEHQAREASLDVSAHMDVGQFVDTFKECQYLSVVFKETDYRFVESGQLLYGS